MTPDSNSPTLIAADADLHPRMPSPQGGPGRSIRVARERSQMTVEELATQTKLTRVTLEALERDDFEALNEPLYVRGYYRKCAKVLALSEAELIAGYERLVVPKAPQAPTKLLLGSGPAMGSTRIRRRGDGGRVIGLVLVAAVIGVFAWLLTGGSNGLRSLESTTTTTVSTTVGAPATGSEAVPSPAPVATPAVTEPAPISAAPTTLASEPAAAAPVTPPAAPAPSALTPSATPAPSPIPAPTTVTTPAAAPTAAPAASVSSPAPAPAAAPAAAPVALRPAAALGAPAAGPTAAAPAAAGSAPAGFVVLNFKSTSWVRVEDADGKLLLSGVVQAGDRQQVRGRAPYSLFIGNAPGVSVEYDGKPVDTAPYVKSNSTARFSIP